MFLDRVDESPDDDAFYYPVEGGWQESSWGQTRSLVEDLAAGLLALGIEPEDRVAIIASTRYEWVIAHLAALWSGAAVTAVDPTADDDTSADVVGDSWGRGPRPPPWTRPRTTTRSRPWWGTPGPGSWWPRTSARSRRCGVSGPGSGPWPRSSRSRATTRTRGC